MNPMAKQLFDEVVILSQRANNIASDIKQFKLQSEKYNASSEAIELHRKFDQFMSVMMDIDNPEQTITMLRLLLCDHKIRITIDKCPNFDRFIKENVLTK